ncbi:hypothetical protein [Acinetobacter sp. Ver3]|uniref:hypothetical protein n=1 Tax=Acinetobacter sp. Ver3 TaxID=466088 RepID=UPI0004452A07|nr:hypothetical protein [Acinetobacter sp. Ver3]EZQ12085.1 hypothetical protein CL42_02015 [Acinetobacter sp. Ver3]
MCGGVVGKVIGTVTDAVGLTDTKAASKGFDAQAAEAQAKKEAQLAENDAKAQRKKRKASDVLASAEENEKKTTLGG